MQIPSLIIDLAVMMLTAGIITVMFKKIKQPLILGYILAGFLLSPYFPWFANIIDTEAISTWSEIGIIFLMFHLGLEFNIQKLFKVGSTAFITCIVELVGMTVLGYFAGSILGLSSANSLFLGLMLVMSSTMIVIKVLDELNIKEKYTELVFGILVVEDIVGIFMMIVISTVSVSKNISGMDVAIKLFLMVLYLVVWLLIGIYVIPTLLNKTIKYMSDEMLIVCSLGLCLGMVLLANLLGFSSALGAFLSGSLLAGTVHVERVENLTKGIKDLFGAIFFISVGMMVDPVMIGKYIVPILVSCVVLVIGKLLTNTLGMLLSGQDIKTSIESGFIRTQIGEFSFIIANLGYSLGIIDEFLYPVIVAVSVITTFTTPYLIKLSKPATKGIIKLIPKQVKALIDKYTSKDADKNTEDSEWIAYIKDFFKRIFLYGGLMIVFTIIISEVASPSISAVLGEKYSNIICLILSYIAISVFTVPLIRPRDAKFTSLWLKSNFLRLPLIALNLLKIGVLTIIVMLPLRNILGLRAIWLVILAVAMVLVFSRSSVLASWYLDIETNFLKNFNERTLNNEESKGNKQKWLYDTLHIISVRIKEDSEFVDKRLIDLNWGNKYSVYVVKIKKREKKIVLPEPNEKIGKNDKVYIIGEKIALENFYAISKFEKTKPIRTIKEFMESGYEDEASALSIIAIKLSGLESYVNKTIRQGNFKKDENCLICGIQKDGLPIIMPDSNTKLKKGDILWVMGTNKTLGRLAAEHIEEYNERKV